MVTCHCHVLSEPTNHVFLPKYFFWQNIILGKNNMSKYSHSGQVIWSYGSVFEQVILPGYKAFYKCLHYYY